MDLKSQCSKNSILRSHSAHTIRPLKGVNLENVYGTKCLRENNHEYPGITDLPIRWPPLFSISYIFGKMWHFSGGSKGGVRDARPPGVQILSIPCSFWENLAKLCVHVPTPHPRGFTPPPTLNPGSVTAFLSITFTIVFGRSPPFYNHSILTQPSTVNESFSTIEWNLPFRSLIARPPVNAATFLFKSIELSFCFKTNCNLRHM